MVGEHQGKGDPRRIASKRRERGLDENELARPPAKTPVGGTTEAVLATAVKGEGVGADGEPVTQTLIANWILSSSLYVHKIV
jgi:hypothetical protein